MLFLPDLLIKENIIQEKELTAFGEYGKMKMYLKMEDYF